MDRIHVLIVDDEKIVREGLFRYIDWEEYNMYVAAIAENGEEALEIVKCRPIDLVIADIHMPIMDGMELISRLENVEKPPLVILISGFSDFTYAQEAVRSEIAQDYILKPLNFEQMDIVLSRVGQKIVQGYSYVSFPILDEEEWKLFTRTSAKAIKKSQNEIIDRIKAGDFEQAIAIFEIGIRECQSNFRSINYISRYCIEIALSICEIALDRMDSLELLGNDPVQAISKLSSENEIFNYVKNLMATAVGAINRIDRIRYSPLIHSVIKRVNDHFDDNLLSLNLIADECSVSPSYLSIKFKEEVKVTFNKYLNGLRIKKAKELLMDFSLKVYMVSEQVGYGDVRYFSRIFRKTTGYSPTEYQKNFSPFLSQE